MVQNFLNHYSTVTRSRTELTAKIRQRLSSYCARFCDVWHPLRKRTEICYRQYLSSIRLYNYAEMFFFYVGIVSIDYFEEISAFLANLSRPLYILPEITRNAFIFSQVDSKLHVPSNFCSLLLFPINIVLSSSSWLTSVLVKIYPFSMYLDCRNTSLTFMFWPFSQHLVAIFWKGL